MKFIAVDAIAPVPWRNGGGHTRELFTDASGSDWRVRVSLAEITQDGPFSAYPGVQRHFAVLEGEGVVLTLDGVDRLVTRCSGPIAFDGAQAPACRLVQGPTRDLNLMLQGGASGTLQAVKAAEPWAADWAWRAVWLGGPATLQLPDGGCYAHPQQTGAGLLVNLPKGRLCLNPQDAGLSHWLGAAGF